MTIALTELNWLTIIAAVVLGQVILTLWFTVLLGDAWARAYGAESRAEHTKAVPGSAYGIGALCTLLMTLSIAIIQQAAGVAGFSGGLIFGIIAAVGFGFATVFPGYGFLVKQDAGAIAAGSQAAAIFCISILLAVWQ